MFPSTVFRVKTVNYTCIIHKGKSIEINAARWGPSSLKLGARVKGTVFYSFLTHHSLLEIGQNEEVDKDAGKR